MPVSSARPSCSSGSLTRCCSWRSTRGAVLAYSMLMSMMRSARYIHVMCAASHLVRQRAPSQGSHQQLVPASA
eukprot:644150-Alexandrium_andersonii.AAC.1